jgi:hypothetical protein
VGYHSIGIERDQQYINMAQEAIPSLAALPSALTPSPTVPRGP